jgi:hypothetical protein
MQACGLCLAVDAIHCGQHAGQRGATVCRLAVCACVCVCVCARVYVQVMRG